MGGRVLGACKAGAPDLGWQGQKERGRGSVAHTRYGDGPAYRVPALEEGWEMQKLPLFRSDLGEEQV